MTRSFLDGAPPTAAAGPHNDLTDVRGIEVGHFQRSSGRWLTGTTVVLPPEGTVAGVDVRGGGPGTRETDLLDPRAMMQRVDAICLSGGSAYGLAAADGTIGTTWCDRCPMRNPRSRSSSQAITPPAASRP